MASKEFKMAMVIGASLNSGFGSAFNAAGKSVTDLSKAMQGFHALQKQQISLWKSGAVTTYSYQSNMAILDKQLRITGQTMSKIKARGMFQKAVIDAGSFYYTLQSIGGYLVKPIQLATGFEKAMSNVKAISGATGEEFKLLQDKAREMGSSTSKNAKESADALGYMALAGWNTKQMLEGVEPVLRLSEAGNLELARTSDLVTDSMSSLGLQTNDLTGYLDMVAKTSNSSNTNIEQLMEAMIICGGTMKNANVPIADASSLLGILANRGKKGSEAGNALNTIMINLTTGAGQAGKAMQELGISAFNVDGSYKSVASVLKEVNDKTNALTAEEKTHYLAMIGGKTQYDTLQALLGGIGDEYDRLNEKVKNSTGALRQQAKTQQDNFAGASKAFQSAAEELGISIGSALLPPLTMLTKTLTPMFAVIASGAKEYPQLTAGVIGLAAGVTILTAGYHLYSLATSGLIAMKTSATILMQKDIALKAKDLAITGTKTAFTYAATAATGAWTAAQWLFNAALSANPIGLVIVGVGALIAAGYSLYTNWDAVKSFFITLWNNPLAAVNTFGKSIISTFTDAYNWVMDKWNNITSILSTPIFGKINIDKYVNTHGSTDVAQNAAGGIYGESGRSGFLTTFAENGTGGESAIPHRPTSHNIGLLAKTNKIMGNPLGRSNQTINANFAPNITVQSTDQQGLNKLDGLLNRKMQDFKSMLEEVQHQNRRVSYE